MIGMAPGFIGDDTHRHLLMMTSGTAGTTMSLFGTAVAGTTKPRLGGGDTASKLRRNTV
jgi:hypothetical protein